MNILVLSDGYPTESHRMSGLFAFDQAKALKKAGHNVVYGCVNLRSLRHKNYPGKSIHEKDGMTIYSINFPLGRVPVKIRKAISCRLFKILFQEILDRGNKIDIVHAHFYDMAYCAAVNKKLFGYELIVTEHYSGYVKGDSSKQKELKKHYSKAYELADHVLAVSNNLAVQLRDLYGIDVQVVPNVVDTSLFNKVVGKRTIDKKVRFVSVGRLSPEKNMPLLIEAFAEAYQTNHNMRLTIVGDGPQRKSLLEMVTDLGLENQINLTGALPRESIVEIMENADCFILLSNYETFGVAYIEALAAGLPVIATKCGGPQDFMTPDMGLMIECRDKTAAIEAIQYMSIHHQDFSPENMSRIVNQKYSPDSIAEHLRNVYIIGGCADEY